MKSSVPGLLPLFRSETQLAILGLLFAGPSGPWTISEIADTVDLGLPTVSREVSRLAESGIVTVQIAGRTRLVAANWDLPWARALAELLDRTIGPLAKLSAAFADVRGISSAWIYGSWAERYHGTVGMPPRDLDVLVVGDDVDILAVTMAADRVSDRVALPVHVRTVSTSTWEHPERGSFIDQLKRSPLVAIPMGGDG